MWVVPRENLTDDQLSAVTMSSDKHRVIVGGPGSGKTLVLAHRAAHLLAAGTSPDRLRLLVFTNVLSEYLREGLAELGLSPGSGPRGEPNPDNSRHRTRFFALTPSYDPQAVLEVVAVLYQPDEITPEIAYVRSRAQWRRDDDLLQRLRSTDPPSLVELNEELLVKTVRQFERSFTLPPPGPAPVTNDLVSTFDSWCLGMFDDLVKGKRPRSEDGRGVDYEAVRAAVLKKVRESGTPPMFDVVLVDEGQDLTATAVELLTVMSKHVTLALDGRQQLYDTGMDVDTACSILNVPRAAASLLSAYRCTPLIVDIAAQFLPTPELAAEFRASNLMPLDGVETPAIHRASSRDAQMDELAQQVAQRAILGQQTAVLVPTNMHVKQVLREMAKRDVQCAHRRELTFGDSRPVVLTYHSAKGLTVDCVLLPFLTNKAFKGVPDAGQRKRILFVGVTRATHWVWLGTDPDDAIDELTLVEPLLRRQSMTDTRPPIPEQTPTAASQATAGTGGLADLL